MTRPIPLFTPVTLIDDYQRRIQADPLAAKILKRFPTEAKMHMVGLDLAELMRMDAQHQGYCMPHPTPVLRTYRAMARQIERRYGEIREANQIRDSVFLLRFVIGRWVQPPDDPDWRP